MNSLSVASGLNLGPRCSFARTTLRALSEGLKKDRVLILFTCLIFLVPVYMHGQSASDVAESRLSCVRGLAQEGVERVRAMGVQMGPVEMCVKALNWTANNGKLLDIYMSETGPAGARLLINRLTDSARASAGPFRPTGSPLEMWNKGELTPSLAFDAGFARSYLEKQAAPSDSMNPAELKRRTEGCLNQTQSLAVCVDAGRMQGALAYQMNNAFSDNGSTAAPASESQGPDRAQTQAAIDQKFQNWSQSWSFDRYRAGSAEITNMNCSDQCKASGRFSFVRFGSLHTINFVAFLPSEGDGKYSLGRLCYNDETTNMQDCTD